LDEDRKDVVDRGAARGEGLMELGPTISENQVAEFGVLLAIAKLLQSGTPHREADLRVSSHAINGHIPKRREGGGSDRTDHAPQNARCPNFKTLCEDLRSSEICDARPN
jgi:hypothetical protein